jgi:hypothetical protein
MIRQYAVRLRHDGGWQNIVTAATGAAVAVELVLATEGAPQRSVQWVAEQPICNYCDQPATRRTRDGGEFLCRGCARSQTDGPLGDYVTSLLVTQWPRVAWHDTPLRVRFVARHNAGSGDGVSGSYRVIADGAPREILVAVSRDQARFSVTWLNERQPDVDGVDAVQLAAYDVAQAWQEYVRRDVSGRY